VSLKPPTTHEHTKKKRTRKKKTKQTYTYAVPHIRLLEANTGKLEALEQLVVVFQALCQQYLTRWCTAESDASDAPDRYAPAVSEDSSFDYWLRISTLDKGHPLRIPVKLRAYHKKVLKEKKLNTSTTLSKRNGSWWLTLSFDQEVALTTEKDARCVGVDVGIANFLTTSTGKQYGTFHGKLARRHKRDREKRRRKAKLRACLEKKGVRSGSGRLSRERPDQSRAASAT